MLILNGIRCKAYKPTPKHHDWMNECMSRNNCEECEFFAGYVE